MAVLIFSASPGVGKTYLGTALVLYWLEQGLRVAVNWEIRAPEGILTGDLRTDRNGDGSRGPDYTIEAANLIEGPILFRFERKEDLIGLTDCQIGYDEAQVDNGSRDWEELSKRARLWLSMHRHYRINLFFFTQHYKFIDVYFRRIGVGGAHSLSKFLNLTFCFPRPDADAETGELGKPDIFGALIAIRPWRSIDLPIPMPGFWKLLGISRDVPNHYTTHSPKDMEKRKKISRSERRTPQAGPPAVREPDTRTIPML